MIRKETDSAGNTFYYNEKDQYHREDGPAVEYKEYKYWLINVVRHRINGPAIEWSNIDKSYYIMDKEYSYKEWLAIKDFSLLW